MVTMLPYPSTGLLADQRIELSPSLLKSWSRCHKQYFYKAIQGLRWPSENGFVLGTTVHKLMDYQARGLTKTPSFKKIMASASAQIVRHWTLLDTHPISHWPVIANEWGFQVPLKAPYWLAGRIDRVAQGPDGKIWVLDWKTGTGVPKNKESDWQTLVYCHAVVTAGKDLGYPNLTPNQVCFAYVEVRNGRVNVHEVAYTETRDAMAQRLFIQTLDELETAKKQQKYELPPHCPDKYCSFSPICGIGQSLQV
jgi:RecB family exonuclease